jgi:oxidase EvaA
VFGTQVAPSVQATQSNYRRVHGGLPTPLIDWFLTPTPDAVTLVDVPQSEQGPLLPRQVQPQCGDCRRRWVHPRRIRRTGRGFSAGQVIQALAVDFTVNTDARSVLSCADWRMFQRRWRRVRFAAGTGRAASGKHSSIRSNRRRSSET